jgi:hypothetical protein
MEVCEKNGVKYADAVAPLHFFRTSPVMEIIDEHTFKTFNSIYKIEDV